MIEKRTITESEFLKIAKSINISFMLFSALLSASFVLLAIYKSNEFLYRFVNIALALLIIAPDVRHLLHYKEWYKSYVEDLRGILSRIYNIIED